MKKEMEDKKIGSSFLGGQVFISLFVFLVLVFGFYLVFEVELIWSLVIGLVGFVISYFVVNSLISKSP